MTADSYRMRVEFFVFHKRGDVGERNMEKLKQGEGNETTATHVSVSERLVSELFSVSVERRLGMLCIRALVFSSDTHYTP
jgi:hypothetical protein